MATTTMSTSTLTQTAPVLSSTSAPAAALSSAPPVGTTPADIANSLQQALHHQLPGGGGGGGGGGGPPPAPPQANIPQQPAQPVQDVKMMGTLLAVFNGDCMYTD